jgi:hypothetical protein
MAKYELARVNYLESNIDVYCTNTNELEILSVEALNIGDLVNPSNKKNKKIEIIRNEYYGSPFGLRITNFQAGRYMRMWIIKWFCDRGWEPFSHYEGVYSFRRTQE